MERFCVSCCYSVVTTCHVQGNLRKSSLCLRVQRSRAHSGEDRKQQACQSEQKTESRHLELQDYAEGSGMKLFISKPSPVVFFLQQSYTSKVSPESTTNLRPSVQTPETLEDVSHPNHPTFSPSTHLHPRGRRKAVPLIPPHQFTFLIITV